METPCAKQDWKKRQKQTSTSSTFKQRYCVGNFHNKNEVKHLTLGIYTCEQKVTKYYTYSVKYSKPSEKRNIIVSAVDSNDDSGTIVTISSVIRTEAWQFIVLLLVYLLILLLLQQHCTVKWQYHEISDVTHMIATQFIHGYIHR